MVSTVWFNDDQIELYKQLKKEGSISQAFAEFVKNAFYDKIDSLNITKLTELKIEELTKQANK